MNTVACTGDRGLAVYLVWKGITSLLNETVCSVIEPGRALLALACMCNLSIDVPEHAVHPPRLNSQTRSAALPLAGCAAAPSLLCCCPAAVVCPLYGMATAVLQTTRLFITGLTLPIHVLTGLCGEALRGCAEGNAGGHHQAGPGR